MKKILLIEDELHKRQELSMYLDEFVEDPKSIKIVDNVREAVIIATNKNYDLIVLDMALPTFTTEGGAVDGGLDQALGGIEILRILKSVKKYVKIIIVTQYPDVSIDGKRVKLRLACLSLNKKYKQNIIGAVLYKYKSTANRSKMKNILGKIW